MKKYQKILALALSALMIVGMFAGCGGSSAPAAAPAAPAATEAPANREGEVNQQAFEAEHSTDTDRVLKFGIFEWSVGVDPAQEVNTAWNCSRYGIGECLFRFDNSMSVVNWLCDSYTVNDEHTEWVFHIRDGVTFSDGCALTPSAVKASFERLFKDGEKGSSKPKTFLNPDSVMTADDASGNLTIVTPAPVVDLTKNLCYPVMIVLDTEHTTDYVAAPIGTGPYAAKEFKEHVGMTVVRNEHYWKSEVPYASIELIYMGDASAKAMALQAGQIDLAENIANIADLNTLRNDPEFTVTIANGVRTGICHFNVSEGKLLSNATLRHAIIKALDRETMCAVTVGGMYTPGFSVLPSNLDYGYKNLTNPDPYDPDEAMRIMDEAGIIDRDGDGIREMPDGTKVMLKFVSNPSRCLDTFAEAVQQQLTEVGIGVDLNVTDGDGQWTSYETGDFDMNASNWTTVGVGDPTEYMNAWWADCEADYCGYNNAEYNELFAKLQNTFGEEARKEIIQRLQQILIDDAAALPYGYYNSSMISRNSAIGGAAINTADYYWVTTDIYPAK